jgi:hypothetical protein
MITNDGETPVSETVQQEISAEKEIAENPDDKLLDPARFRIDQSELDQPVVKPALTAIAIRQPRPLEFIRTHPDPTFHEGPVRFIKLRENREFLLGSAGVISQAAASGVLDRVHLLSSKSAGEAFLLADHDDESHWPSFGLVNLSDCL